MQEEVDRHGGVASLHLRHTGLARTEALREGRLRQSLGRPAVAEAAAQREFGLDERSLRGIQIEKVFRGSDAPTLMFEGFPYFLSWIWIVYGVFWYVCAGAIAGALNKR